MNMDQSKLLISQMAAAQDAAGYKDGKQTQAVLAELSAETDPAKAYAKLASNMNTYFQTGASITELLNGLKLRFPGYDMFGSSGSSSGVFNNK